MGKSATIEAQFLAMLEQARAAGVQCSVVWRLSDEDFTCASTLSTSSEVRAMLLEVVARNDRCSFKTIGNAAASDDCAACAAVAKQGEGNHGET